MPKTKIGMARYLNNHKGSCWCKQMITTLISYLFPVRKPGIFHALEGKTILGGLFDYFLMTAI